MGGVPIATAGGKFHPVKKVDVTIKVKLVTSISEKRMETISASVRGTEANFIKR